MNARVSKMLRRLGLGRSAKKAWQELSDVDRKKAQDWAFSFETYDARHLNVPAQIVPTSERIAANEAATANAQRAEQENRERNAAYYAQRDAELARLTASLRAVRG